MSFSLSWQLGLTEEALWVLSVCLYNIHWGTLSVKVREKPLCSHPQTDVKLRIIFFFSVLGIEIRALHLLGKYVSHTPALLFVLLLCWYNIQLYNFHYLLEVGQRQECWKKRDALFLTIFLKIWQHRRCRWLTPVIVATWEAEIRSTMVPGQPRKRFTRPHLNP
jgi:hypothetical protein